MIKKTVAYTDYNNTKRTDDLYFNLTTTELLRLNAQYNLETRMKEAQKKNDGTEMIEIITLVIASAFGTKSADGKSFLKDKQATDEFMQSAAYDALFVSLVSDEGAMEEFIRRTVPNVPEKKEKAGAGHELGNVGSGTDLS